MIFKNSRRQGPLLAVTFLSVGCLTTVTEQPYNPFLVPADTVRSVVNTVIVTPAVPPEGVFVSAMAASRIDSVIAGIKMRFNHKLRMREMPTGENERLAEAVEQLQDEVRLMREEFTDLHERVDFTERILSDGSARNAIRPPESTPV